MADQTFVVFHKAAFQILLANKPRSPSNRAVLSSVASALPKAVIVCTSGPLVGSVMVVIIAGT